MVRLQAKPVEEGPEERARGEPEPSLEVGDEDHPFPGFRGRLDFFAGAPTFDAIRNPPGSPQPGEFGIGNLGPFPSGALAFLGIVVRGMPRHDDSRLQKQGSQRLDRCEDSPRQLKGRQTELKISTKSYRDKRICI